MGKTIDVTPTWKALVPAMLAVIENHEDTPSGWAAHGNIFAEFMRMADAADRWNAYVRSQSEAGVTSIELTDEQAGDIVTSLQQEVDELAYRIGLAESHALSLDADDVDAMTARRERLLGLIASLTPDTTHLSDGRD